MIYSVWNQGRRLYDYYETPDRTDETSAPKPRHLRHDQLGMTPEQAAWPLPSNAAKTGEGKYPRGFVATRKTGFVGLSGVIPSPTPTNLIIGGIIGYFVWKWWKKRRS